jgi:hypothetical protein
MQQPQRAKPYAHQKSSLQELVERDQFQPAIALLPGSKPIQGHLQFAPENQPSRLCDLRMPVSQTGLESEEEFVLSAFYVN